MYYVPQFLAVFWFFASFFTKIKASGGNTSSAVSRCPTYIESLFCLRTRVKRDTIYVASKKFQKDTKVSLRVVKMVRRLGVSQTITALKRSPGNIDILLTSHFHGRMISNCILMTSKKLTIKSKQLH